MSGNTASLFIIGTGAAILLTPSGAGDNSSPDSERNAYVAMGVGEITGGVAGITGGACLRWGAGRLFGRAAPGSTGRLIAGSRSVGAASVRSGLKGLLKDLGLPVKGKVRFVPPRNAATEGLRRVPGGGLVDRFGNVWRRPRGQIIGERHWDVQLSHIGRRHFGWASRSGNHINVSPDGRIVH
jgi:hypothetical protein